MLILPYNLILLCLLPLLIESNSNSNSNKLRPKILKRTNPTYSTLTKNSLKSLNSLTNLNDFLDFNSPTSYLSKLLIPRSVGSKNLTNLQLMVTEHFKNLNWHIEKDKFDSLTPYGIKTFTNLIFTHDIQASRRLVLSAHLDSKFYSTFPENQFIGATDSAAPCAMLLDLASALTPWLDQRYKRIVKLEGGEEGREIQGETLQIVFFDGEEAFKDWTDTDSIYGARHLADLWSKPTLPPTPTHPIPPTPLSRISHLVLLDLLGSLNPVIRSFYPATGWFFDEFIKSERTLGLAGYLFPAYSGEAYTTAREKMIGKERSFFIPRNVRGGNLMGGGIGDDHVPFLEKGVPVVHVISVPFPKVWHTLADNASALDLDTLKAWALIIRLTVAEYLGLDPEINNPKVSNKRSQTDL